MLAPARGDRPPRRSEGARVTTRTALACAVGAAGVIAIAAGAAVAATEATVKVGSQPNYLDTGNGFVWVANTNGKSVSVVNADTNAVKSTIKLGGYPNGVEYGGSSVWVVDGTCFVGQSNCTPK